jgi:hypothetical protein
LEAYEAFMLPALPWLWLDIVPLELLQQQLAAANRSNEFFLDLKCKQIQLPA